jgi:hypothetical protein
MRDERERSRRERRSRSRSVEEERIVEIKGIERQKQEQSSVTTLTLHRP